MEGERVPVEIFGHEIHIQDVTYLHCKLRELSVRQQAERALLASSRLETTDTLTGGMAHDINDLMTGVLGYAELLGKAEELTEDTRNMIGAITAAAKRAGEIAQQMLATSRKESDLRLQPVDVNEIARDTSRLLWKSTRTRIKYDLELDDDLPAIYADPGQIRRAITSICRNAVESIEDEGHIQISSKAIELKKRSRVGGIRLDAGTWVSLSVQDNGSGMDPDVLANVFEPFFSTKYRGRGTGLASTKAVVDRHAGRMGIESEVGSGTTVTFFFPPWTGEQEPASEAVEPETVMGDETVMIIDDDEAVGDVLKRMLEMHGYSVLLAHDGLSSIRMAESYEGEIHLAVLDMTMPVMSGVTAFPLLREVYPEMRVLVTSGHQYNESVQELLDKGASGFLQKPISPQTLIQNIRATLDGPAPQPISKDLED
jgi:signal transduction histidine kinase/CheY-like chemotaxis protein